MCTVCSNVHRRSKATRNHTLLANDEMPTESPPESTENLSEYCEDHPRELIKYFCPTHKSLHCGDCIVQSKHRCEMEMISTVSGNFKESSDYRDIEMKICALNDNACKNKS